MSRVYVKSRPYAQALHLFIEFAFRLANCYSGSFVESKTKTFELIEDDPKAVADLLHHTYAGSVPPTDKTSLSKTMLHILQDYLRAWILADKYRSEFVANQLVSAIINYVAEHYIHPGAPGILGNADLHETSLYELLATDIWNAWDYGCYDDHEMDADDWTEFESVLAALPQHDMIRLFMVGRYYRIQYNEAGQEQVGTP